jgi:hypothetical protein
MRTRSRELARAVTIALVVAAAGLAATWTLAFVGSPTPNPTPLQGSFSNMSVEYVPVTDWYGPPAVAPVVKATLDLVGIASLDPSMVTITIVGPNSVTPVENPSGPQAAASFELHYESNGVPHWVGWAYNPNGTVAGIWTGYATDFWNPDGSQVGGPAIALEPAALESGATMSVAFPVGGGTFSSTGNGFTIELACSAHSGMIWFQIA